MYNDIVKKNKSIKHIQDLRENQNSIPLINIKIIYKLQ